MSSWSTWNIRCDYGFCDERLEVRLNAKRLAQSFARGLGWQTGTRYDYCPLHRTEASKRARP